jgi:hypothetical protein
VLAGDQPVIVLQQVQRLGQVDELSGTLSLDPLAEEAVAQHAQRGMRVPGQILRLDRGLARADQHAALLVDRDGHRRELGPPITPDGGEHRMMVSTPVLVRQPVRTFLAAQERRSGLQSSEPLTEVTAGDQWDAGDQVLVHLRRAGQ